MNLHTSTAISYCGAIITIRTRFIHHILLTFNNKMLHRHEVITDLELKPFDNVEYLTWYGIVNVASTWHAHMVL